MCFARKELLLSRESSPQPSAARARALSAVPEASPLFGPARTLLLLRAELRKRSKEIAAREGDEGAPSTAQEKWLAVLTSTEEDIAKIAMKEGGDEGVAATALEVARELRDQNAATSSRERSMALRQALHKEAVAVNNEGRQLREERERLRVEHERTLAEALEQGDEARQHSFDLFPSPLFFCCCGCL